MSRAVLSVLVGVVGCTGPDAPPGGTGTVEGTIIDLSAGIGERIAAHEAAEGTRVEAGAVVIRLDCRRLEARTKQLEAQVAAAEAQTRATEARARAAGTRIRTARAGAAARRAELEAVEAEGAAADREAARLRKMEAHAPERDLDQADSRAEALGHRLRAAREQARIATRNVEAAEAEAEALSAQEAAARAQVAALEAEQARLAIDLDECAVTTPRAAWIEDLFFEVGERAPPGSPLVRLVDLDDVWVTFYLPNDELGALTQGRKVEVRADAYPDEVFEGTVRTIATEAEFTPRNIQTREDRTRLVYPVEVHLENPEHRLRPGMPVEVRLVDREGT